MTIGRVDLIAQTILTASSDVANSLEGIDTTGYVEGSECYCQENDGVYVLYPADVQAPSPPDIVAATGGGNWILKESPVVSSLVVVTGADTTPGTLDAKVADSDGITTTVLNPGGNEQLQLEVDLYGQLPAGVKGGINPSPPAGAFFTHEAGTPGGTWTARSASSVLVADESDAPAVRSAGSGTFLSKPGSDSGSALAFYQWFSGNAQTTFYVDPSGGSDSNDGLTSGNPLQTFREVQSRLGGIDPIITSTVNIYLLNDCTEAAYLKVKLASSGRLNITGNVTTPVSGATVAGGATQLDYTVGANGSDAQITSGGVADFSIYEAFVGANPNARLKRDGTAGDPDTYGWVDDTVGGVGTARVTRFATNGLPDWNAFVNELNAGDTFDVQLLPSMSFLTLDVQQLDGNGNPPDVGVRTLIRNIYFNDPTTGRARVQFLGQAEGETKNNGPIFVGCSFNGIINGLGSSQAKFFGCHFNASMLGVSTRLSACSGALSVRKSLVEMLDVYAMSGNGNLQLLEGTVCKAQGLAAFDVSAAQAVFVDETSNLIQSGSGATSGSWGSGMASDGFVVNGRMWYTAGGISKMAVTGNENVIGGVNVANAALPSITAANNAMIVVKP